jgi:hypothetical protein
MAKDQIVSCKGKWSDAETTPTESAATTNRKMAINNTVVIAQPPILVLVGVSGVSVFVIH